MLDYFDKLEIYVGFKKVKFLTLILRITIIFAILYGTVLSKFNNVIVDLVSVVIICILFIFSICYMNHLEKLKNRIIENGGNEEMDLKKIINLRVFSIDAEELEALKSKQADGSFTCADRQCFIHKAEDKYIAVENSSGELFIEEFKFENDAYIWLAGFKESEPLQAAEQEDYWY